DFENDIRTSTKNCNQDIKSLITKILKSSNSKKEWFKRYRLEEFYPLTPEDVVTLQHKSDRGFNINTAYKQNWSSKADSISMKIYIGLA
ncbi:hypothetical protein OTSKATO_1608, partial [Orientia tsutsugamushi str. Kato PP]